ncbi:MAG TPA: hypothetical protein VLA93_00780 [Pyrinomonadaceae bacterium]|nr:hypothetical protein [Pyrinomonadaceae bacterium]
MAPAALMISLRYCLLQFIAFTLAAGYLVWTISPRIGLATQETQKTIKQRDHRVTDPIKIVGVSINSKPIDLNKEFTGDSNWLRGAEVRLKNTSNRNITYVEIHLYFPETRGARPEMLYWSGLGIKPAVPSIRPPLMLPPGDEVTFRLGDEDYEGLVGFIGTRSNLAALSKVELKIGFVVFDDLLGWQDGVYSRQDANHPRRWVPLSNQSPH